MRAMKTLLALTLVCAMTLSCAFAYGDAETPVTAAIPTVGETTSETAAADDAADPTSVDDAVTTAAFATSGAGTALTAVGIYRSAVGLDGATAYTPDDENGALLFSEENLTPACLAGKWGYVDVQGTWIIPAQYDAATPFDSGHAVVLDGNSYRIITADGTQTVELTEYEDIQGFVDGMARVKTGSKYGFINTDGELAVAQDWENVGTPSEDRIAVCKDGVWGYVNYEGTSVVTCRYTKAEDYSEGYALAWLADETGAEVGVLLDEWGNETATGVSSGLHEGLAIVQDDESGMWSFCKADGTRAYIDLWLDVGIPSESMIPYQSATNSLWGYLNMSGEIVIEPVYDAVYPFVDGMARVAKKSGDGLLYGFVTTTGELLVDTVYTSVRDYQGSYAAVYDGTAWGYVDAHGSLVIPCQYAYAGSFDQGIAAVVQDGSFYLIDTSAAAMTLISVEERAELDAALAEAAEEEEKAANASERKGAFGKILGTFVLIVAILVLLLVIAVLVLRYINIARRRRRRAAQMAARRPAPRAPQAPRRSPQAPPTRPAQSATDTRYRNPFDFSDEQ